MMWAWIGATAVGSPVVKVDSIQGLAVGQVVTGTGIPAGSVITAIAANTSFTMEQPSECERLRAPEARAQ